MRFQLNLEYNTAKYQISSYATGHTLLKMHETATLICLQLVSGSLFVLIHSGDKLHFQMLIVNSSKSLRQVALMNEVNMSKI